MIYLSIGLFKTMLVIMMIVNRFSVCVNISSQMSTKGIQINLSDMSSNTKAA